MVWVFLSIAFCFFSEPASFSELGLNTGYEQTVIKEFFLKNELAIFKKEFVIKEFFPRLCKTRAGAHETSFFFSFPFFAVPRSFVREHKTKQIHLQTQRQAHTQSNLNNNKYNCKAIQNGDLRLRLPLL